MREDKFLLSAAVVSALLSAGTAAMAHHSFAVFFEPEKNVSIKGEVQKFTFTNPHAIIEVKVVKDGRAEVWRVESNAPTLLLRRGWTKTTVKPGQTITVEGWPARDGSKYMRVRRVLDADGKQIGQATPQADQK